MDRVKIIGMGNEDRQDDGIGIVIAQRMKAIVPPGVTVKIARREALELLDFWKNANKVMVIDAVNGGGMVGKVYRFSVDKEPLPCEFSNYSTHSFSLDQVIELAKNLDQLPPELIIFGIQGKNFQVGRGISKELERNIERVVSLISDEVK